ncbi:hypothetical protein [Nocardioides kribbensis]
MTGTTGSTTGTTRAPVRGPFDVWAPVPDRVRLHVAGAEPVG